jgi:hypothetical protein
MVGANLLPADVRHLECPVVESLVRGGLARREVDRLDVDERLEYLGIFILDDVRKPDMVPEAGSRTRRYTPTSRSSRTWEGARMSRRCPSTPSRQARPLLPSARLLLR